MACLPSAPIQEIFRHKSVRKGKPVCFWFSSFLLAAGLLVFGLSFFLASCSDEEVTDQYPFILFKQGDQYIRDGQRIPVGGQMNFGISAVGGGQAITNLRVKRITAEKTITELDRGIYIPEGGIDTTMVFIKSDAESETWNFFIMNENRDTASVFLTVFKGDGSAYGEILYYPSITLGYPSNTLFDHFLDANAGVAYAQASVAGHEQEIDVASFYYVTSGKPSPTLTCPGYTSAVSWYPDFASWPVKNSTTYDYKSTDNDLVTIAQFDSAQNDSLLVAAYNPQYVSGLCKFCYSGKVIPFKTSGGKYGMIKVIRADEQDAGSMEIAIKIQP